MRKRATFDFHFHHLTNARSNRDGAVMKDQATPERSLTLVATRIRCGILFVIILHSVLMRVVSKVNRSTPTVGGWDLASVGDSVAVSDLQASEPEAGFWTANSSYGTDLSAAVPSPQSIV